MMRHLLPLAVLAAAALAPASGQAAFIKRDVLLRTCAAGTAAQRADCESYIAGVTDSMLAGGAAGRTVCLPERIELRALRDAVAGDLESHRQGGDGPAAAAVREALRALFPCPAR